MEPDEEYDFTLLGVHNLGPYPSTEDWHFFDEDGNELFESEDN